ncbi:hypothetical protein GT347_01040 [Xylophilus rhododendri]|uniref:Uncharacterized protein n=1 Tax=Xylophilus rhododendri TaxID=2697032 RepID=A0A857J0I5_9BURK|nr:hypothetical protein [Xylophilus rhododendri]QHI96699.1 hypothetical protein GT347_01040 [Xylophilus rhododendri]
MDLGDFWSQGEHAAHVTAMVAELNALPGSAGIRFDEAGIRQKRPAA